ncbi:MAG TPA: hypothetical protein ENI90_09180 [Methylothermaceae bacterium]|nr:hypothetical protein [Methylothermaceae bacterium]
MDEWLKLLLGDVEQPSSWEPDFEADRWLVQAKIGPFRRLYLRPPGFRPRFYHRLYPLPVSLWQLAYDKTLFDGLCHFQVRLKIRYQVTLAYVRRHPESLGDPDGHVRGALKPLVEDLLDHRTHLLQSGDWIERGLTHERRDIEEGVNLLLARHHLQCRTICELKPEFVDPGDDERALLFQERIYRAIEERRQALQQLRFEERKRRQQERQRHEAELIRLGQEADCRKETAEGERRKKLLEIRQQQQAEVQELELRLHEEALKHQERLASMEIEQRIRVAKRRQAVDEKLSAGQRRPGQDPGRQQDGNDATPMDQENDKEEGDEPLAAYQSLMQKLQFDTALAPGGKSVVLPDLEQQLKNLIDNESTGTGISATDLAVSSGWLRRLLQRLLYFLRRL